MSQKAWMNAYTKGSKSMQKRLELVHKNNPEFQEFVKKHGFGGNLSKKQSELQKKPSVATVKPVSDPHPEKSNLDREALIKAAAEKLRNRRLANANRVAFGGELGGGFQMPGGGFRRYSESVDEDIAYKDGAIAMRRGGWIAKREGKQVGIIHPTEDMAKAFLDNTRLTLGRKIGNAIRKKAKEVARALDKRALATESAANRRRVRSWIRQSCQNFAH
jgi:hypothetical protein